MKNLFSWVMPTIVGVIIGAAVSWWINRPIPPWIEFNSVEAIYIEGSQVVNVYGVYTARKVCSKQEQETAEEAPPPLVWRQEVRGTGSEIVSYAPRPDPPSLQLGTHKFRTQIPLNEGIEPDGWSVSITVSCDTEALAVRSKPAYVQYLVEQD